MSGHFLTVLRKTQAVVDFLFFPFPSSTLILRVYCCFDSLGKKIYTNTRRPAILYGTKYWVFKKQHIFQMIIVEMRMLKV